jgi:hypothetical protein
MSDITRYWRRVVGRSWSETEFLQSRKIISALVLSLTTLVAQAYLGLRGWRLTVWFALAAVLAYALLAVLSFLAKLLATPAELDQEQSNELRRVRDTLATADLPQVSLSIGGAHFIDTMIPPGSTAIVLDVEVRNDGSPTVLRDWKLEVAVGGSSRRLAVHDRAGHAHEVKVNYPGSNQQETLRLREDALEGKIGNSPLVRGGEVGGVLLFHLANATRNDVAQNTTCFFLTAKDATGREVATEATVEVIAGGRRRE